MDVFEIEAVGVGVALHGDAVAFLRRRGFFHVVVERARGGGPGGPWVRDDLRVGILDCGEKAVGHFRAFEIHVGVHGGDDDVELGENFVVQGRASRPS